MSKLFFLGLDFCYESKDKLYRFCIEQNIPNLIDFNSLHCTIIYSKKPFKTNPNSFEKPLKIYPQTFTWGVLNTLNNTKALVLKINNQYIIKRHKILSKNGVEHLYKIYVPHITVSYDIGNQNIENLKIPNIILKSYNEYFKINQID